MLTSNSPDLFGLHYQLMKSSESYSIRSKLWTVEERLLLFESYEIIGNSSYKLSHKIMLTDPHTEWMSMGVINTLDYLGTFPAEFQVSLTEKIFRFNPG